MIWWTDSLLPRFSSHFLDPTCFSVIRSELDLSGRDQFDRLYAEAEHNARVMAISIHPYITGVPHRIKYLEALLDYIGSHEEVEWMTASQIGDWYGSELQRLSGK